MFNKVILVGRLAQDPRHAISNTGTQISNFTIAVNVPSYRGEQLSAFLNCVAFSQRAQFINNYLKKGDLIAIEGALQTRSYTNKNGQNVYITEVLVDRVESISSVNKKSYQQADEPTANVDQAISGFSNVNVDGAFGGNHQQEPIAEFAANNAETNQVADDGDEYS